MDRRESLKSLLIGGVGVAGLATGVSSCKTDQPDLPEIDTSSLYGRTPKEIEHDKKVNAETFFSEVELSTVAVLCDLILPPTPTAGGALDAGVPEFIEFIVKDLPTNQLPLQGGLMWLNGEANKRYDKIFESCSVAQQKSILDDIAYPDPDGLSPQFDAGRKFFTRMRNFVLTGYYTTKIGIDDLGYVGNRPNLWDGPPEEVLQKHGMQYDSHMEGRYIDHDAREVIAEWDEKGNLLT